MKEVVIHTDGACRGNPGPGGWGALLQYNGTTKSIKGSAATTTNNRMEITAAIRALETLTQPCRVILITDSNYLRQGITQWLPDWKRRGWRTADKKPVKNTDLWQQLEQVAARHHVEWRWVRGHSGDVGNEAADLLANEAIDEMLSSCS